MSCDSDDSGTDLRFFISQTVNLRNSDVLRTHSFSGIIFQVLGARTV